MLELPSFLCTSIVGVAMSSPIGFREFNEDDYRRFIRTLSDQELLKAGKRLRILCGDVITATPSMFDSTTQILPRRMAKAASQSSMT
jgi:hypothetical protein